MSLQYQDYYKSLGVERGTSQDEIQKAYRKLAREFHPDINKEKGAEDRFKEINEAYEVLGDADKRKRYDALGANWRAGQDFRPPPGFENVFQGFGGQGGGGQGFEFGGGGGGGLGGFSDFFSSLFGAEGSPFTAATQGARGGARRRRGADHEAAVTISLEDSFHGAKRMISLTSGNNGTAKAAKSYQVTIPKGIQNGSTIRLAGQGGQGPAGDNGDLLLRVSIAPHARFKVDGSNLRLKLSITPWEAALGGQITVSTFGGNVQLRVPKGAQGGQLLRLRGKGLPKGSEHGDLIVELRVSVPKELSKKEEELFTKLQEISKFNPR